MIKQNLISVIIPVYNGSKYIDDIFNCFFKQSYKNFELIFINDGSTDNSLELIQSYSKKVDFDLKIINQSNAGVSSARNLGITKAKGDFICFCDVDDLISADFLGTMHHSICTNIADVVICKFKTVKTGDLNLDEGLNENSVLSYSSSEFLRMYLYGEIIAGVWNAMFRKQVITKNNLFFENGYKYSEDLHFMWRVCGLSEKIVFVPFDLYFYRWNADSAMSKFDAKRFDGYMLMKKLETFWNTVNPEFGLLFEKYAAARIMWSIMRQGACKLSYKQFKLFFSIFNLNEEMRKLLTYRSCKVRFSAFIYLLSPLWFYLLAKKLSYHKVH